MGDPAAETDSIAKRGKGGQVRIFRDPGTPRARDGKKDIWGKGPGVFVIGESGIEAFRESSDESSLL